MTTARSRSTCSICGNTIEVGEPVSFRKNDGKTIARHAGCLPDIEKVIELPTDSKVWLYADGATEPNPGPSGIGVVAVNAQGIVFEKSLYIGVRTNNEAEFGALIGGLRLCITKGLHDIEVRMDSRLIVNTVSGAWRTRTDHLKPLQREAKELLERVNGNLDWVLRDQNSYADGLAVEAVRKALAVPIDA